MNTIEAMTTPEQARPQDKPAERPAPDAPPLRVFVKENNAYVLQYESADFQLAMKKAEQLYNKGQDILVNEKGRPQVVHAKSNLHNDVDVGREVHPAEKDGRFVRGTGEVLHENFLQRFPLNADAFEKQQKDAPAKAKAESHAREPSVPPPSAELEKAAADTPTQEEPATPVRKAILKKTGFVLPEQVLAMYTIKDGRYHDRTSDALRFQDHGKKLSTQVEDRVVVSDMIAIAAAKSWDHVELKGSETFRQMAWQEAELRGIRTTGYKPSEHDLQQLDFLKRERGAGERIAAAPKAEKDAKPVNTIEVNLDREVQAPASAKEAASHVPSDARDQRDGPKGAIIGRLVDHGRANYNHDKDEKPSYYVTLQTPAGERTVWGKDLERSMAGGQFKAGDGISLEVRGAAPVKIDANVRGDDGTIAGRETISAHRNEWEVKPAGLVVMRTLSADEKLKVDAAYRILDKELAKYPEDLRREILGRFTLQVEKDEMKLPIPQVSEKSKQAQTLRRPEMERTR
jgi:hypothetical protein